MPVYSTPDGARDILLMTLMVICLAIAVIQSEDNLVPLLLMVVSTFPLHTCNLLRGSRYSGIDAVVVAGPSGVGKGTIIRKLMEIFPQQVGEPPHCSL